ncbi:MAG: iron ABC transporter permease [Spirochaetes bacterium]|nr:iron ABC transporter permease [Spirochaetota bacterium]
MNSKKALFSFVIYVVLAVLFVYPFGKLFMIGFVREGSPTFLNIADIMSKTTNLVALRHTLFVAVFVTILAVSAGVVLSWLVTRTNLYLRNFFKITLIIPYIIPPFISAFAWMQLLSPVGYLNKIMMFLFHLEEAPVEIYGKFGIIVVSAIYTYPLVYIAITKAFERIDPSFEEAARIAGAGKLRVVRDITLPVMMPAVGGAAVIVFVTSTSMFGIPAILGIPKGYIVLTTKIFLYIGSYGTKYNFNLAAAMSMLLIIIGIIGLLMQNLVTRKEKFTVITGKASGFSIIDLGALRIPATIFIVLFILFIIAAPVAAVIITSLTKAIGLAPKLSNFTLGNYKYILFSVPVVWRAIRNSFFLALTVPTITVFLSVIFAYTARYTDMKGKRAIDYIVSAPYAIPGTVIGLSMILAWIKPVLGISLYNTIWLIMIAYIARFMIFPMRTVTASIKQVDNSLAEAAQISGASKKRAVLDIIVPLIKPGIFSGWFLVFMPALTELTLSILLYSAGRETIGVTVYNMTQEGLVLETSALALLIIVVILALTLIVRKVSGKKISAV